MKIRSNKTEPLIVLSWKEYRKRRLSERFPVTFLCGILAITASMSFLHDKALKEKASDAQLSVAIHAMEEFGTPINLDQTE